MSEQTKAEKHPVEALIEAASEAREQMRRVWAGEAEPGTMRPEDLGLAVAAAETWLAGERSIAREALGKVQAEILEEHQGNGVQRAVNCAIDRQLELLGGKK